MTAVVDASALVSTLIGSDPEHAWADSLLADQSVFGPEMVLAESSNILRRLERSGRVPEHEIAHAYTRLVRFDIELLSFTPFAERIWELRNNLTCYDAWYVAIAEMLDCPLITLDQRLSRSTGPACEFITPTIRP